MAEVAGLQQELNDSQMELMNSQMAEMDVMNQMMTEGCYGGVG